MNLLAILLICAGMTVASKLEVKYKWKCIEYVGRDGSASNDTASQGKCDGKKVVPFDVAISKDERLFITTPRLECTNEATISTVSNITGRGGPLLAPYPSWEYHAEGNCSGITSVLKVFIDKCNRLWIVDSGKIRREKKCPAQIIAFDLETDEEVFRSIFPDDVVGNGVLAVYDIETKGDNCEEIVAYIADLETGGILLFHESNLWRLDSKCLKSDRARLDNRVAKRNVWHNAGSVGGMRVSDKYVTGGLVVFWSFNMKKACAISIADAHNSYQPQHNTKWLQSGITFPSRAAAGVMTGGGVAFGAFVHSYDIFCASMQNRVEWENMIELHEGLKPISSMSRFYDGNNKSHLAVLVNKFPERQLGEIDCSEENYQILISDVESLINGTVCAPTTEHFDPLSVEELGFHRMPEHDRSN